MEVWMDSEIKETEQVVVTSGRAAKAKNKETSLRQFIEAKNDVLLSHLYFRLCRSKEIGRKQMLEIVKQLYCFSVFFERLLTRRIAEYKSGMDPRVIAIARRHLREEIGHAELFFRCLEKNGVESDALAGLTPKMFTTALFGYLTATIQNENEYVTNVAIMQVMEGIGYHFFSATLEVMQAHGMMADAMQAHSEDDEDHAHWGMELVANFDERTMIDSQRVIADIYRLMGFVLDEWLGLPNHSASAASERRRRTTRPPRSN
jgi:hypothetical protein